MIGKVLISYQDIYRYMAIVLDLVLWFRKVIGLMINIWYDTIKDRVCIKCRVENNRIFPWKSYSLYFMNFEIQHKNFPKDKISKKNYFRFYLIFIRQQRRVLISLISKYIIGLGSSHSCLSHILIECTTLDT